MGNRNTTEGSVANTHRQTVIAFSIAWWSGIYINTHFLISGYPISSKRLADSAPKLLEQLQQHVLKKRHTKGGI